MEKKRRESILQVKVLEGEAEPEPELQNTPRVYTEIFVRGIDRSA